MAKKTKDELLKQITVLMGDNKSDDMITFIEDLSDSFVESDVDLQEKLTQAQDELSNLQTKYDNLDNQWRERYISRFNTPTDIPESPEAEPDKSETITIDDLFTLA